MIEAAIFVIVLTWAVRKTAEYASEHWQSAKAANRKATRGQPVRQRAASAARHDAGYWAGQVRGGFPQVRHGLYMGWHSGRIAQLQGREQRAQAKADHAETRARVTEAVREQRRRQAEAFDRIRAARQPEPEPEPAGSGTPAAAEPQREEIPAKGDTMPGPQRSVRSHASGSVMPGSGGGGGGGDTTYTQQMRELEEIRRDAEAEVNEVRRKRMANRLDVLMSLGLDKQTCAEAAAIDDALQAQEKAAQQTLDATDAAIAGLRQRHGGIQEAVSDSPVDQPAQPEFYQE